MEKRIDRKLTREELRAVLDRPPPGRLAIIGVDLGSDEYVSIVAIDDELISYVSTQKASPEEIAVGIISSSKPASKKRRKKKVRR